MLYQDAAEATARQLQQRPVLRETEAGRRDTGRGPGRLPLPTCPLARPEPLPPARTSVARNQMDHSLQNVPPALAHVTVGLLNLALHHSVQLAPDACE